MRTQLDGLERKYGFYYRYDTDEERAVLNRLLAAKVLSPAQEAELVDYRDSLNPAVTARRIADLQAVLLKLAKDKAEQIYLASFPTALPDIRKGIRVKAT